jgi:WD40-like Beta Propeller Repeat
VLWCLLGAPLATLTGSESAFGGGGQSLTLARNGLWSVSLTGGKPRRLVRGLVRDAVWSVRGLVALVRGGWIWVGRPGRGKLWRLARGDSPSFSPDGARLAFARDGYVRIVAVRGRVQRRLVKGGSPTWSPDGRQIAYIGPGGAVEIVAVRGGRPHPVGGSALDWQPLPALAGKMCEPPSGATVLASSREAVVYSLGTGRPEVYGCLEALGRPRLVLRASPDPIVRVIGVKLAGRFAAIETTGTNQYAVTKGATLYDLSSGAATPLGGVDTGEGPEGGPRSGFDSLALDSSGFAAWRETTTVPFPEPISAVSCPSSSLCIAGDGAGDILSSTNPAGGQSAWSMTSISASRGPAVTDLSCPSSSLCLGLGSNYGLLSSTEPTGGAGTWEHDDIDPENFLDALSCPSVSLCVAIDVGDVLTSTDPTGGPSAWRKTSVGQDVVGYVISCPSASLCVGTVTQGNILTSNDPTGGVTAWRKTQIAQANVGGVSCPSVTLCVVGSEGGVLTSTNPTGCPGAWTATPIDQGNYVTAISCPSVSLCVAIDAQGNILSSTDPAGGVGAWSKASVDPALNAVSHNAVSCPSVSLCVAGDQNGNVLASTDPTGGANAWTIAPVDRPPCASQPSQCVTEQLYARDDQGTQVVDSALLADGNLIGNVILDRDSLALTWTHDGTQRQLQLR